MDLLSSPYQNSNTHFRNFPKNFSRNFNVNVGFQRRSVAIAAFEYRTVTDNDQRSDGNSFFEGKSNTRESATKLGRTNAAKEWSRFGNRGYVSKEGLRFSEDLGCTLSATWHVKRGRGIFKKSDMFILMARSLTSCSAVGKTEFHSETPTEAFGVTESGNFTISEEELRSRGLEVCFGMEDLDMEQLNDLFVKVGFPSRNLEKLKLALHHTISMAWVKEIASGELVAFSRATGDSVFNAIVWDVAVLPRYQGSGLGKVVMERLMAALISKGICNIALYAEPTVVGFYKPLGFVTDPDGIRGMAYRRRK